MGNIFQHIYQYHDLYLFYPYCEILSICFLPTFLRMDLLSKTTSMATSPHPDFDASTVKVKGSPGLARLAESWSGIWAPWALKISVAEPEPSSLSRSRALWAGAELLSWLRFLLFDYKTAPVKKISPKIFDNWSIKLDAIFIFLTFTVTMTLIILDACTMCMYSTLTTKIKPNSF